MRDRKLFLGQVIRSLRDENALTQAAFAKKLSISTSYLNQLENNQRHATASILLGLAEVFGVDIASLSDNDSDRLLADLTEALADPLFKGKQPSARDLKLFTQGTPTIAQAFLSMHQALRRAGDQLAEIDDSLERSGVLDEPSPYEEVRDFFHYKDNYIDELDKAGEALSRNLRAISDDPNQALIGYLSDKHSITVRISADTQATTPIRVYHPTSKLLTLSRRQSRSSNMFQMAHQIARVGQSKAVEKIIKKAKFRSSDAEAICRIGLSNYFAGATIMPYKRFLEFAHSSRHDLEVIAKRFDCSLEQVAHRLSTLQRMGSKGIPFFFARIDQAGNITKRHSATKLQFARFGSTCPLWNAHSAFATPGKILRQLAETPDGAHYLCLAIEVSKPGIGYNQPTQRHALALGCETKHADDLIYADGLDLENRAAFDPIGISCRICERQNCHQRAIPPLKRELHIDVDKRRTIPYSF